MERGREQNEGDRETLLRSARSRQPRPRPTAVMPSTWIFSSMLCKVAGGVPRGICHNSQFRLVPYQMRGTLEKSPIEHAPRKHFDFVEKIENSMIRDGNARFSVWAAYMKFVSVSPIFDSWSCSSSLGMEVQSGSAKCTQKSLAFPLWINRIQTPRYLHC